LEEERKSARVRGEHHFLPFPPTGIFQKRKNCDLYKRRKKNESRARLETKTHSPAICNTGWNSIGSGRSSSIRASAFGVKLAMFSLSCLLLLLLLLLLLSR
jgi:hypothetical protein